MEKLNDRAVRTTRPVSATLPPATAAIESSSDEAYGSRLNQAQRSLAAPGPLTPGRVLALQRTVGNRAVQRMLTASRASPKAASPAVQRFWSRKPAQSLPAGREIVASAVVANVTGQAIEAVIKPYIISMVGAFIAKKARGTNQFKTALNDVHDKAKTEATDVADEQLQALEGADKESYKDATTGNEKSQPELLAAARQNVAYNYKAKKLKGDNRAKTEQQLAEAMLERSLVLAAEKTATEELAGGKLEDALNSSKARQTIMQSAKKTAVSQGLGVESTKTDEEFEAAILTATRVSAFEEAGQQRSNANKAAMSIIESGLLTRLQGKHTENKQKRDDLKSRTINQALGIMNGASTDANKAHVRNEAVTMVLDGEGGVHSKFARLGVILDKLAPKNGDKTELEVTLKIPVDPHGTSAAFVGFQFGGEVERDDGALSFASSIAVVGGGQIPSGVVSMMGAIGGYMEATSQNGGAGVVDMLSYYLYRQCRESPIIPRELTNYLWGMGGASVKEADKNNSTKVNEAKYQEAEDWGRLVEAGMGDDDYVEGGVFAGFSGKAGFSGIAGASAGAEFGAKLKTGLRYDKKSVEKYRGNGHGEKPSGSRGRQKGLGNSVTSLEFEVDASGGIVGGEGSLGISFISGLSSASRNLYGFKDGERLISLEGSLGGYVGLPPGTPGLAPQIVGAVIPGVAGIFQGLKSSIGKAVLYFKAKNKEQADQSQAVRTLAGLQESIDAGKLSGLNVSAQETTLKEKAAAQGKEQAQKDSVSKVKEGLKRGGMYGKTVDYAGKIGDTTYGIVSSVSKPQPFDAASLVSNPADSMGEYYKNAAGNAASTGLTKVKVSATIEWPGSGSSKLMPELSVSIDLDSSTGVEIPGIFDFKYARTSRIAKLTILPELKLDFGLTGKGE
ncbi:MAG TPA: hypothetical protein VH186_06945 [Chloroflexia bacterium]|nr:hypothetical protein [Chloroflexia bacterium]